jgi:hypothetical protein
LFLCNVVLLDAIDFGQEKKSKHTRSEDSKERFSKKKKEQILCCIAKT